ncbi:FeoB-associated Cys-rich membrane protein [Parasutterella secunda]|uniref:FeoB-associated Cys-rich membrane protein n=1 Tax=Parasutterella secunda TaxID=626947 RepID=UPI0019618929|nr:FeoB-associated Cys-rich membrane protein [Parasutterella secunda]
MNGISWLLLILIVLAVIWVIVFKMKNRSSGDCGCGCSSCHTGRKKTSDCCSTKSEQIIHIQKMGR